MNYTVYHLHSDRSLLDSVTNFKNYIDKAKEYGMKAIGFSEHGNIFNWLEKKMYCDEVGIKYIHGCEFYLTEQLTFTNEDGEQVKRRDNFHTILIAKNMEGLKELNALLDLSTTESHTYYKNRISFDEFLAISDNIIKISSCIASPLNKLNETNCYYEKLLKHYDYYEIQYHNDGEQNIFNQKLYKLSIKYNKPLIVGTDTHSLNSYKAECRHILKKAKRMAYDNEDSYDLTFKSYEELVDMFKIQDSLPEEVVLQAIHNTNKLADSCEDVILDKSIKYPQLSNNDTLLFEQRVFEKLKAKIENNIIPKDITYLNKIQEEIRVFKKINMCSFMLFMSELCTWCLENDIPIGFCRGSVGGSTVAYILDIIDVDPVQWNTVFSRFANEDRVEIGDIDIDFCPSQREAVYKYIMDRFTKEKSAFILTLGTLAEKGAIDDIGRALEISLSEVEQIKKDYEKDSELTKSKHPKLFYYLEGLLGVAISQGIHPAGIVVSPITLPDNYGTFWKDSTRVLQINMEEVHDGCGLVKYDILGLKNIEIIKNTCELAGIPYPKSKTMNWEDEEVWKHITDSPVGIFQFEGKQNCSR